MRVLKTRWQDPWSRYTDLTLVSLCIAGILMEFGMVWGVALTGIVAVFPFLLCVRILWRDWKLVTEREEWIFRQIKRAVPVDLAPESLTGPLLTTLVELLEDDQPVILIVESPAHQGKALAVQQIIDHRLSDRVITRLTDQYLLLIPL